MKDIVIRVGGTAAEICAEQNGNVVKLRPRQGRAAAAPFAHRSRVATTTDPEQPPVVRKLRIHRHDLAEDAATSTGRGVDRGVRDVGAIDDRPRRQ